MDNLLVSVLESMAGLWVAEAGQATVVAAKAKQPRQQLLLIKQDL